MNNDLISRSALLNERPEYLNTDHIDVEKALFAKGWNACAHEYYSVIDNAPAADAEVVRHGRYGFVGMDMMASARAFYFGTCSECRERINFEYKHNNYCPNCGAKMDAEDN